MSSIVSSLSSSTASTTSTTLSSSFVLLDSYQYCIIFAISVLSCTLSIIGSFAITVASCKNFDSIYQRLIFMISVADMISSISFLFHPLLLPEWVQSYGLLFAMGNITTCNIAGYLLSVSPLLVTFYSFYMSIFFYIKVKYNVTDDYIKKKKYHYIANTIALLTSFILPLLKWIYIGYRPAPFWNICYVGKCQIGQNLNTECTLNAHDVSVVIGIIYVLFIIILVISSQITMFLVYWTVRQTLLKNQLLYNHQFSHHDNSDNNFSNNSSQRFRNCSNILSRQNSSENLMTDINNSEELNHTKSIQNSIMIAIQKSTMSSRGLNGSNNNNQRNSSNYRNKRKDMKRMQDVRTQGFLYAIVYWNSCFWIFLIAILDLSGKTEQIIMKQYSTSINGYTVSSMILMCIVSFMYPLQGFLNFLVYTRPRYIEYRTIYKEKSRFYAFRNACSLQPVKFHTNRHNHSQQPSSLRNNSQRHQQQQQQRQKEQEQEQYSFPSSSNLYNDRISHDDNHHHNNDNETSNNRMCIDNNKEININDRIDDLEDFVVNYDTKVKEKDNDIISIDHRKNDDVDDEKYNNEEEIIFSKAIEDEEEDVGIVYDENNNDNNNKEIQVVAKFYTSISSSHKHQQKMNDDDI